jgi:hypothetical protein
MGVWRPKMVLSMGHLVSCRSRAVILSEAEGSAFYGRKKQIPPLRFAPVGMTGF